MRIKLNAQLNGHKIGDIIEININDRFWRRRLKDSKIDNCIEIIADNNNISKVEEINKIKKSGIFSSTTNIKNGRKK